MDSSTPLFLLALLLDSDHRLANSRFLLLFQLEMGQKNSSSKVCSVPSFLKFPLLCVLPRSSIVFLLSVTAGQHRGGSEDNFFQHFFSLRL
jgi:hypothetical protein